MYPCNAIMGTGPTGDLARTTVDAVLGMLDDAEERWEAVAVNRLKFEGRKNYGEWLRAWGIALNEFVQRPD